MAVFPSISPVYTASKQTTSSPGLFLFGDGYERATQFGVNPISPEWRLIWDVTPTDADTIEAFLQARSNAGESFDWQPPDRAVALRWRCDEWTIEQPTHNWFRVSATFRRVYELTTAPSITPVATICTDDTLCESDFSIVIATAPGGTCEGIVLDTNAWNNYYVGMTMTATTASCTGYSCVWYLEGAASPGCSFTVTCGMIGKALYYEVTCPDGSKFTSAEKTIYHHQFWFDDKAILQATVNRSSSTQDILFCNTPYAITNPATVTNADAIYSFAGDGSGVNRIEPVTLITAPGTTSPIIGYQSAKYFSKTCCLAPVIWINGNHAVIAKDNSNTVLTTVFLGGGSAYSDPTKSSIYDVCVTIKNLTIAVATPAYPTVGENVWWCGLKRFDELGSLAARSGYSEFSQAAGLDCDTGQPL